MRIFILKQRWLQEQQPLIKKVLLLVSTTMLSSDLYAQRYRSEYDDVTPTPWWLSMFIVIVFSFYLWMRKSKRLKHIEIEQVTSLKVIMGQVMKCLLLDIKDNPTKTIVVIAVLVLYTIISLCKMAYYIFIALLCIAALCLTMYIKYGEGK